MRHPIINEDITEEMTRLLETGELSGFKASSQECGTYVRQLESEFRAFFGVSEAVAFNSATSALHASMIACDVSSGDEVIVTPYSFSASVSCVRMVGAKPVFVDIRDDTFNIDPELIEKKSKELYTGKARAIIPVHLHGHPADMDEIMACAHKWDYKVVEDASQAIGAEYKGRKVGTIGDCGVFSFNQSKPISTGEGGMLITNDPHIARVARAVRNHAEVSDPELGIVGYNYRMTEMVALLALRQFQHLDEMNDYRIGVADYMTSQLPSGIIPPIVLPDCKHVYYTYAMKYKGDRDALQDKMIENGVYFGKGYVKPLNKCPVAERMEKEIMVIDWLRYPITKKDIDKAITTLHKVLPLVVL